MLIFSKDNSKIKEVRKLRDNKYSKEKRLFIIEGDHLVEEAIKCNSLLELYVLEGFGASYSFPYNEVTLDVMKSMSDMKSTPRVIGVAKMNSDVTIGKRIIVLDELQDPGNAGTIIRSAVAFGIDTIIFSSNSVNPYNEKTIRSTEGMIFKTNIIIGSLKDYLEEIKEKGIPLIGTSLNTPNSLKNIDTTDSYAIVFGNEGNGVSEGILSMCDKLYRIDMNRECESLNVGVSCGIILYKLFEGNN